MSIAQNTPLCKVFYDRSAKQYHVRNGELIATFPSGKANKIKAQWLAIQHDNSDVYDAAQTQLAQYSDTKEMVGRILRAARLVIEGKVQPGRVESQTHDKRSYEVSQRELIGSMCGCQDWQDGREARFSDRGYAAPTVNGETVCKHIIATRIAATVSSVQTQEIDVVAQRKADDWNDQLREQNGRWGMMSADEAYAAALRPDPINLKTNFYNPNIERR